MSRPGLRRTSYNGPDREADKTFRAINDQLSYFQDLPTTDGALFQDHDIPGTGADVQVKLNHHMGHKARGVYVISCKPRQQSAPSCPSKFPVHLPNYDTEDSATVFLAAGLADVYVFSFWVW